MRSGDRPTPDALAGADVAVESAAPEAEALAALLRREGADVRVVEPDELDRDPRADAAFLDSWTPEVAPRVVGLRRHGALVTSLADLLLARARERVVGITGTAGKTTTTFLLDQLLDAAGVAHAVAQPGLSGNLWPDASLVPPPHDGLLLLELTSSHLSFCHESPHIAVVTCFWPDHVELHGSLEAYARAKQAIARHQRPGDLLVLPDDGGCDHFAGVSPATVVRFSLERPVDAGVFVHDGRVVARWDGAEHDLGASAAIPLRGRQVGNALAAAAAALAAGARPAALAGALERLEPPPFRLREVARVGEVAVYDDSMAGTPAKAAAALETFPDGSVVLVAGGALEGAAGEVHGTEEERRLLDDAIELAARKAVRSVVFGSAASFLAERLPVARVAATLDDAVAAALADLSGAQAVLVAPMYPVSPADRDRVAPLARRLASTR